MARFIVFIDTSFLATQLTSITNLPVLAYAITNLSTSSYRWTTSNARTSKPFRRLDQHAFFCFATETSHEERTFVLNTGAPVRAWLQQRRGAFRASNTRGNHDGKGVIECSTNSFYWNGEDSDTAGTSQLVELAFGLRQSSYCQDIREGEYYLLYS